MVGSEGVRASVEEKEIDLKSQKMVLDLETSKQGLR